jgi:threonine synthase
MTIYQGLIEKYKRFLPITEATPVVSLNEGNTPLLKANVLSERLGLNVYLKFEGLNPTGSFKDRGMTVAMSKALEEKATAIICASTGNTSASAAAYTARAGLTCAVIIPEGKIAMGKLAQALMHGAKVIAISGNFDAALSIVRQMADTHPISLVNSINQHRIEGQKTAAFEICDSLGDSPDYLAIPVGNAGNISAYWIGFNNYFDEGITNKKPKMLGFQAEGAAPIVKGHIIEKPETIDTAIRIGNPARWKQAEEAAKESGGFIRAVNDDEIIDAYKLIARTEGYFAEPASAASVAGLIKNAPALEKGSTVVCILTGHGLKDPDTAINVSDKIIKTGNDISEVEKVLFESSLI